MGYSVAGKGDHIDCVWIFTHAATVIVQIINCFKKLGSIVYLFYWLLFLFVIAQNYLLVFLDYYLIIKQFLFEKLLIFVDVIVRLENLFHTIALQLFVIIAS